MTLMLCLKNASLMGPGEKRKRRGAWLGYLTLVTEQDLSARARGSH